LEFTAEPLCFGNRLNGNKLVGALTDVVQLWQDTVMEVGAGQCKQTIAGDECRLTATDLLAPSTQLAQSMLQTLTVV